MNKNTQYIVGLISIICISVVINTYLTDKKDGFTTDCNEIKTSILRYCNTSDYFMKLLKSIESNKKIDYSLTYASDNEGISFILALIFLIDIFNLCINQYPNLFIDLFENKSITDEDFIVMYDFYNVVKDILQNAYFTLLKIDYKSRSKIMLPISNVSTLTINNKDLLEGISMDIKRNISVMQKISNKIYGKQHFQMDAKDDDAGIVNMFDEIYSGVKVLKQCKLNLSSSIPEPRRKLVFTFLKLIRTYIKIVYDSMDKYIAPALNNKLKNGQKIPPIDRRMDIEENPNGATVSIDTELAPANSSILSDPSTMLTTGFVNTG